MSQLLWNIFAPGATPPFQKSFVLTHGAWVGLEKPLIPIIDPGIKALKKYHRRLLG